MEIVGPNPALKGDGDLFVKHVRRSFGKSEGGIAGIRLGVEEKLIGCGEEDLLAVVEDMVGALEGFDGADVDSGDPVKIEVVGGNRAAGKNAPKAGGKFFGFKEAFDGFAAGEEFWMLRFEPEALGFRDNMIRESAQA